jgi:DNA-binding NarL/FixJ family response regulator
VRQPSVKTLHRQRDAEASWNPIPGPSPLALSYEATASAVRLALGGGDPPELPPPSPSGTLEAAAIRADQSAVSVRELGPLWDAFLSRELNFHAAGQYAGRSYVLARASAHPRASLGSLNRIETAVVVRVVCGEQQKFVASELGIAASTASKWYTSGLRKLHLLGQTIPLPLAIVAQAWALGVNGPAGTRCATFRHGGEDVVLLSVPRPLLGRETPLSGAEREIARLLVEGVTRLEIAERRETSIQTVACQIRGVFAKYRLTGRYALIRRGLELGWFRP